jgi:hypothetical protein
MNLEKYLLTMSKSNKETGIVYKNEDTFKREIEPFLKAQLAAVQPTIDEARREALAMGAIHCSEKVNEAVGAERERVKGILTPEFLEKMQGECCWGSDIPDWNSLSTLIRKSLDKEAKCE